jgi:PII-like signaling protein
MLLRQPAKLLRLHFSEEDRYDGIPLYDALVKKCQTLGIAGITVLRGMEGYGESTEIHRRRILAHDQPIVVTVVESAENIERLMPEIEKMVDTGMIAISNVEMIRIQAQDRQSESPV